MALTTEELVEMSELAADLGDEEAEFQALNDLEQLGYFDKTFREKASRMFNPASADIPELDYRYQGLSPEEALTSVQFEGDKEATIGQDRFGNPVINTRDGPKYIDKPGFTGRDILGFPGDVKRVAEDVSPYLAAGGVTAPFSAIKAMGVQGVTGLVKGSVDQGERLLQGKELQPEQPLIEAGFAIAGEGVGRFAISAGARVWQKLFGGSADDASRMITEQGQLTDEGLQAMTREGVDPRVVQGAIDDEMRAVYSSQGLPQDQVQRFNRMKEIGGAEYVPTKAEVTRTADDFQTQIDLSEQSSLVRKQLEENSRVLYDKFEDVARTVKGEVPATGEVPAVDHIINKATVRKNAITEAYKAAREEAPTEMVIKANQLAEALRKLAPSNSKTGGSISSIRGYLVEQGMLNKKFKPTGRVSVETAENARQFINQHWDDMNGFNNMALKQIKDALDNDVGLVVGKDHFRMARYAKVKYESDLTKSGISQFDRRKTNLVRDMLENKVSRDDIVKDVVFSKKYRAEDIDQLVKYYKTGSAGEVEAGTAALNDLKSETLKRIKDEAFKGPTGQAEGLTFTRASLGRVLNKIGGDWNKIDALFPGAEGNFLRQMTEISALREPVRGVTASPSGPAVRAAEKSISRILEKIPYLGDFIEMSRLHLASKAQLINVSNIVKQLEKQQRITIKQGLSPLGAPLAVGANPADK